MSEFKIEKDIPITGKCSNREKRQSKYNFHLMEVGDSVFFSVNDRKQYINISSNASRIGAKENKKFCMRAVDGGARVWRIA